MARDDSPPAGDGPRSRVFTDYVISLGTTGDPPERASLERVWRSLKQLLRVELRRRGLWSSPPPYLGVVGATEWTEDALDELVADAYVFNFVDRLRSLRAQLEVKPNIEGLVRLNLRNFLYERQRRNDPLGCRLFGTLRSALAELIESGEMEVAGGDPEIRNDTELVFLHPDVVETDRGGTALPAEPSLDEVVAGWSDDLLPALVTARGGRLDEVVAALHRRIRELPAQGFTELTVKDLADPLKAAVRNRWRALHVADEPDAAGSGDTEADAVFAATRRSYRPDEEVADAEAFEKLTACVEHRLRTLDRDERSGKYLNDLWQFLRLHAAGERDLPSRRKLADLLGIPRNRFPELYETLGELLERCRKLLLEPPADREGGTR